MGGGELSVIKKTIENTLANIPGIICDGAKISCAAKIAASLDAAFLAHHLAMNGQSYVGNPRTGCTGCGYRTAKCGKFTDILFLVYS